MEGQEVKILHSLCRDHEDLYGSSRATIVALESFIHAIQEFKGPRTVLIEQIKTLCKLLKNTQPNIITLIHSIDLFEKTVKKKKLFTDNTTRNIKEGVIAILEEITSDLRNMARKCIHNGAELIEDGDCILVHTAGTLLLQVLHTAKRDRNIDFSVILLKQEASKTTSAISALKKTKIPFRVVPEYNVSSFLPEATKFFVGGSSITSDKKVLSASGTANICGQCHLENIPSYLFAHSKKYSSRTMDQQKINKKREEISKGDVQYYFEQFSHDVIDLELFDFVISENKKRKRK